jgi:hypothetical protein
VGTTHCASGIERAAEERLHGGEPRVWVCAEVDAEDGEAVVNQRARVTKRLCINQLTEAERLPWDIYVGWMARHELDEPTGCRATFMELTGGVEETWAVANGSGTVRYVTQQQTE